MGHQELNEPSFTAMSDISSAENMQAEMQWRKPETRLWPKETVQR